MDYDVVVIGGGPSGLTAGLYSSWCKMKTVLFEKTAPGGQVLLTERIENYPGFPDGINGTDLIDKLETQAKKFGLEILNDEVEKIEKDNGTSLVYLKSGKKASAYSVIIATGASLKKLGVKGEDKFIGKGVSYCATCDGPFFKNKDITLVGGGNAAIEEAIFLTRFVKSINLIHRKSMLRATQPLQDALKKTGKVKYFLESTILEILGDETVKGVKVKNIPTEKEFVLDCRGVFIFVGVQPSTGIFKDFLKLDKNGFILTAKDLSTSKEGIFSCGDVRAKTLRQVVTATGDGALAAFSAQQYRDRVKGIIYK